MEPITTAVEEVTIDSNRIIHETKVDFISRNIPNVIRLVQYDMTLPIISVALHQAGVRYALPTGAACNIRLRKPDGTIVYNPAYGCDSTRTVVYFVVSAQMTVVSGETNPVIEVLVNGRLAGSSPLRIVVEENPVKEDDIVSEDEVQAIIAYVEQASEARDEAVESSESAEAWAVGKIDGTDVPSTADQYHNNAKYYAEQAVSSASTASTASTNASASASSASTSATSAQNAQQAIENMTASVSSLEPDATPTVTKTTVGGVVNLAFGIPRGQDGEHGETSGIPVEELTQAQYDALPEASKLDEKLYLITDGDSGWEAESVEYDNTDSGLTADNVQDAIDELDDAVDEFIIPKSITDLIKPTLQNGSHYQQGCRYIKIGCFVYVLISVEFSSAPSNQVLFALPQGYKPIINSEITVSGGGSYNAKAQCQINASSGNVSVTSADKWVIGNGIFLVAGTN